MDAETYAIWCERIRHAMSPDALTTLYRQVCGLPISVLRTELLLLWMLRWRQVAGATPMPHLVPRAE